MLNLIWTHIVAHVDLLRVLVSSKHIEFQLVAEHSIPDISGVLRKEQLLVLLIYDYQSEGTKLTIEVRINLVIGICLVGRLQCRCSCCFSHLEESSMLFYCSSLGFLTGAHY